MSRSKSLFVFACFALSLGFAQTASAQFGGFLPGTVDDPAEPPESSGGWPFGSDIRLVFSQDTFTNPDPAGGNNPFNDIVFPDSIPNPMVTVSCDEKYQENGFCRCDGLIDLTMTGTAISVIANDDGSLRHESLACADVSITFLDVFAEEETDGERTFCKYTRSAGITKGKNSLPPSAVVPPTEVTILQTCPDEVFPIDEPLQVETGNPPMLVDVPRNIPECSSTGDTRELMADCSLPVGLEPFKSQKDLAAALPMDAPLETGQVLLARQKTQEILTRLCAGTPAGDGQPPDYSSLSCTTGKGRNKRSSAGGTTSDFIVECFSDWKPGESGNDKAINGSGSNTAPFEIDDDLNTNCSALGILAAGDSTQMGLVYLNDVASEAGSCNATGNLPIPSLQCQYDEHQVGENAGCVGKPDGHIVELVAKTFVEIPDTDGNGQPERVELRAMGEAECRNF